MRPDSHVVQTHTVKRIILITSDGLGEKYFQQPSTNQGSDPLQVRGKSTEEYGHCNAILFHSLPDTSCLAKFVSWEHFKTGDEGQNPFRQ